MEKVGFSMANKFNFAEVSEDSAEKISEAEAQEYKKDVKEKDFVSCNDSFRIYLKELGQYPLLTQEEEYNYAKSYKENGDLLAKEALVNHNLRLVVNIAKHFVGSGIPIPDLIQEGNLGLMRAVDMYDPDKGFRFSTYATWWIKQAVTRAIANDGRVIRLPVHAHEALVKYQKFVREWRSTNPGVALPNDDEIMEKLNISKSTYSQITRYQADIVSLSTPVGEEQDSTIGDFIADDTVSIESQAELTDLRDTIERLLNDGSFSEREVDIIKKRFGFDNGIPMTLEQVGEEYGITRERIRQIEAKAIRKFRHPKRAGQLSCYTRG
jgi:RNA polymerase primary sigma factor